MKSEKLNLRKSIGNLVDKLRKLYLSGIIIDICSRPEETENSKQQQQQQKTVVRCP